MNIQLEDFSTFSAAPPIDDAGTEINERPKLLIRVKHHFYPPSMVASEIPVNSGFACLFAVLALGSLRAFNVSFIQHPLEIYLAIAGLAGSLTGLIMASLAFLFSIQAERYLNWIAAGETLRPMFGVFVRAIWWLAGLMIFSLITALMDTDGSRIPLAQYILAIIAVMATAYLGQSIKILQEISEIVSEQVETEAKARLKDTQEKIEQRNGPPGTV